LSHKPAISNAVISLDKWNRLREIAKKQQLNSAWEIDLPVVTRVFAGVSVLTDALVVTAVHPCLSGSVGFSFVRTLTIVTG